MNLREKTEELRRRKERVLGMGGPKEVDRQKSLGKLTVRERLDLLIDPGTFMELGILGHHQSTHPDLINRYTPADGVVTGYGMVNGRPVAVAAWDFTVMAGAMSDVGDVKVTRVRQFALEHRIPMIWLIDSAGARIQERTRSFAEKGRLFFDQVIMSGVVPQIAAMMGPCAAGAAYIPGLADFVPMTRSSSAALAGPPLVKAATGEDVTMEQMGGARVHCEQSGLGDLMAEDDAACITAIRQFLSYLPSNCEVQPPVVETGDDPDRRCEELLDIVPPEPRRAYDVRKVIRVLVDQGEFFEIKKEFARNIVVGLGRMGGRSVGFVANQSLFLAGAVDMHAADKAARFIRMCDAFNIPLVFLMDVPGFMVGSKVEREGIIRHGAKMLWAVAEATVPKATVILRKAYGAGYFVMCGKQYEPDLLVAWPCAEIGLMGAEGAVNIVFRKQWEKAEDPEAMRRELLEEYQKVLDPYQPAAQALIDDIIDPAETRRAIIQAFTYAAGKKKERPWRKHGNIPL